MSTVHLHASGPPETVLPDDPTELTEQLNAAGDDRQRVAHVVAADPTCLAGWAKLGKLASDPIESYAYYRVGYHRGLDKLRQNGWRGSGYVRSIHASNRGFLDALEGLARAAEAIGESDEAIRCQQFLHQLDPER